jgi:NADH dehydrogenase [ubiquinone] 1 alpha subcomplex assembly factor 7
MDSLSPTELTRRIADGIKVSGPIGIDAFMAQALFDPRAGYYVTQKPIGVGGDFTTSPEITQIFGELIGLWLAQSWLDLGAPNPFNLIELGPGQGTLMVDILRVGAKVPNFLAAMRLHLVECNPALREVQAEKLSLCKPIWHDNLVDIPEGPSLIIGNEFLDCMPVRQFVRSEQGWHEKQVGVANGELTFGLGPVMARAPHNALFDDQVGAVRELAPQLESFVATLADRFKNSQGRALLIDYNDPAGHPGDTLQALYRHTKVSPLAHIGQADITAHVDFAAIVRCANATQISYEGPVSQRAFLQYLGIDARAQALITANPHCANDVQAAVERLTSEAHMGTLFSVVCLDSRLNGERGPPLGF